MVRRYEEAIEVRSAGALGSTDRGAGAAGDADAPAAFLWRGRLYVVREVLEHWQERRPWWRDALDEAPAAGSDPVPDLLDGARERRVWRVTASAGRMAGTGVYDLGADHSPRGWRLLRVAD
ncbi:MAG TPA: DUF6504 family protein [Pedococcus sp.]